MKKAVFSFLLIIAVLFSGCGGQKNQAPASPPAQQSQSQHNMQNMEDPNPILAQLNQAIDDVAAKSQANKLIDARASTANIVSITNRLGAHLTDNAFQDQLKQTATALNTEVNKPTPNKVEVDKQLGTLRNQVKEMPNKMMAH